MTFSFRGNRFGLSVIIMILAVAILIMGCKKQNEEDLFKDVGCNTENITYENTVRTILSNQCLVCHSAAARQGDIILETYSDVLSFANNGRLVGSISHASGFVAMPPTGVKLDPCTIDKIKAWVADGSLER